MRIRGFVWRVVVALVWTAGSAHAQDVKDAQSVLEVRYTPTARAQIALWIEDAEGRFLATIGLTEGVATRGIGNRPGASQMNSGFRWPYGRREGVLPIWATRRAATPGAQRFRRVIFQNRVSEGDASQTALDQSPDDYFCLAWDTHRSAKEALDAVSCASVFTSDKGRFITEADVAKGYGEPYEDTVSHMGMTMPLPLDSLYPPRRDVKSCTGTCYDHADSASFQTHAREVMPEIDEVTMATPPGGQPANLLYPLPGAWQAGSYRLCAEVNVEGDYNDTFNAQRYPTPLTPTDDWDSWAAHRGFGYPYRGQPSVVYCLSFAIGADSAQTFSTAQPNGSAGSWNTFAPEFGRLSSMDGMTDDARNARGSGADRLLLDAGGSRLQAIVRPAGACEDNRAPMPVSQLAVTPYDDELHAHEWATLSFRAADDDIQVFRYEVRVSNEPITDDDSFIRAQPAKDATLAAEELRVPSKINAGSVVQVDFGGLVAANHYYIGMRAVDVCGATSALKVIEFETPKRVFATVSPCFVATAAYGTPMASEVSALRRLRDRQLATHAVGRALIAAYWQVGPKLAARIRGSEALRAISRALLSPIVAAARVLDE